MRNLKKFETEEDIQVTTTPNIVLVNSTKKIIYNVEPISDGVYIQHIDGRLLTKEQWEEGAFSAEEANGIAVKYDGISFVVSKTGVGTKKWSEDTTTYVEGISSDTYHDYEGRKNTLLIAETVSGEAALACLNYRFPNGQYGYLPAYGEASLLISRYKTTVSELLTLINGAPLTACWTSSQSSATSAWYKSSNTSGSTGGSVKKNTSNHVRPFTELL